MIRRQFSKLIAALPFAAIALREGGAARAYNCNIANSLCRNGCTGGCRITCLGGDCKNGNCQACEICPDMTCDD